VIGNGGSGAVAFHREKFQEYGPPAGGDGGKGGDVYLLPTPHLTTLSSVPQRVRAPGGGSGGGTWLIGRNAPPTVIRVPVGTVVREIKREDPRRAKDEWEAADEAIENLIPEERKDAVRERRFVHFPRYANTNAARDVFLEAEKEAAKEEREVRLAKRIKASKPIELDLDKPEETERDINAPLGTRRPHTLGHLVASGGRGGKGNPHFVGPGSRSPKFATRGYDGERISLELELRILADVGLVGFPNAGKSTLLKALTGGRANTKVADYAFTTLNPVVGVVRCGADGAFEGDRVSSKSKDKRGQTGFAFDEEETFRFTVADNPGLVERAAENYGLGHAFLRSIERAPVLAYVVDISEENPEEALRVLKNELDTYKAGMSAKVKVVLANKADLLVASASANSSSPSVPTTAAEDPASPEATTAAGVAASDRSGTSPASAITPDAAQASTASVNPIQAARARLSALEKVVRADFGGIPVIPVSAAHSQNLRKVVSLLRGFVEEARSVEEARIAAIEDALLVDGVADVTADSGGVAEAEAATDDRDSIA
jgi:GTP-binding protein